MFGALISSCSEEPKKTAPPVLKIPVVNVKQMDFPVKGEFVGQTFGQKDIQIRARIDGFLEGIYFKEGKEVKKGQLLYKIDSKTFRANVATAKSKLAASQTLLTKARNDLNRMTPLAEQNAVSQSQLDQSRASYKGAESGVAAAKSGLRVAEIQLSYAEIHSPINGVIGMTFARVGDYVGMAPNPIILNTVSQVDNVLVKFSIPEAMYLKYARAKGKIDTMSVSPQNPILELILSDGSLYDHTGEIDLIDNQVDPRTGSVRAQAHFPNPDGILRPGLFARIRTVLSVKKNALLVPQTSVQFIQGKPNVLLVDADNKIKFQLVEVGEHYKNFWEIVSGVKSGDRVVLTGAQKLRTGSEISPIETEFKIKDITSPLDTVKAKVQADTTKANTKVNAKSDTKVNEKKIKDKK